MARAFALCLILAVAFVACGGGDHDSQPSNSSSYTVTVSAIDQLAIGPARFVFLLEDARGQPVNNASVSMRFYFIDPVRDNRKTLKSTVEAAPVLLADSYELTKADSTTVTVGPGPTGVYANELAFDQAGDWLVDMTGLSGNNNLGTIEVPFAVGETPTWPRLGRSAPGIDGEAARGPLMLVFGTAGACNSPVCGPLVEVAQKVAGEHAGNLATRYIEFEQGSDGSSFPEWASAWGVKDEPAVFFIDIKGILRGGLHTIATFDETNDLALSILP